jgi:hypothetical protein
MATIKTQYGTANQPISCTIPSLASGAYRQSAVIDNSTNLFLDALVTVKAKSASSGVSSTGTVIVYAYGTADGTSYDGSCSGTDSAYTPPITPVNLPIIGTLNLNAASVTDQRTFSVAQAFGGMLPQKWGIVVYNNTGASLDASVGAAWYQGIQAQSV